MLLRAAPLAILLAASAAHADQGLRYRVRTDAALERMDVEVCFTGPASRRLVPGVAAASSALRSVTDGEGRALRVVRGGIDTSRLPARACVHYTLDLDAARSLGGYGGRYGRDIATSAGAWLWRPARVAPDITATLRFDLPDGLRAAVPWPRDGDLHRLDLSAFQRSSFTALGTFSTIEVERAGARFTIARLDDRDWDLDDAEVTRWIERAADGVATVQGRFPVDRALILLAPGEGTGVGFGMVRRGGGTAVAFIVGRHTPSEAALLESWVTWHELSHLLLPMLVSRDAWFYEGLATYYQEVLRARAGIQTPARAWGELIDGFRRGAGNGTGRPLREESALMQETREYLHVYWSGAMFMLEADVALRARGSSLDAVIARAARRWRGDPSAYSSESVCELWDGALGATVLRPMRDRYLARATFPDPGPLLGALGLWQRGEPVVRNDAPRGAIRDAIMRAPAAREVEATGCLEQDGRRAASCSN